MVAVGSAADVGAAVEAVGLVAGAEAATVAVGLATGVETAVGPGAGGEAVGLGANAKLPMEWEQINR